MDFFAVVKVCLRDKYATFGERSLRSEFWYFGLFTVIGALAAAVIDVGVLGEGAAEFQLVSTIFSIAILVPTIAVTTRRLHDTNRSGWWQLLFFVPVIGWILLVVWLRKKGTEGANRFGPPEQATN